MTRQQPLLKMLPAKQQTLDFGATSIWPQLSAAHRNACQAAVADLIHQVADATQDDTQHTKGTNDEDE